MKHILVACAIIENEGKVLAAQRSELMSLPLKWEFPGGKIRTDESPEECLKRELVEEMDVRVAVGFPLVPVTHQYSAFTVTLYPFLCTIPSGEIKLNEHTNIVWLKAEDLHKLDWAEADLPVIKNYLDILRISGKEDSQ